MLAIGKYAAVPKVKNMYGTVSRSGRGGGRAVLPADTFFCAPWHGTPDEVESPGASLLFCQRAADKKRAQQRNPTPKAMLAGAAEGRRAFLIRIICSCAEDLQGGTR